MIDSRLAGRGAARADDAQGTPTQSHVSPSILAYEDQRTPAIAANGTTDSRIADRPGEYKAVVLREEESIYIAGSRRLYVGISALKAPIL
jgi:hypothetical protein